MGGLAGLALGGVPREFVVDRPEEGEDLLIDHRYASSGGPRRLA